MTVWGKTSVSGPKRGTRNSQTAKISEPVKIDTI
jgi:hypothetical protein